jgi:hypothetical protein
MAIFDNTGWTFQSSSGGAATGGDVWEVTAGQARLYISGPDNTVYKVIGTGLGIGIGISAVPASVTGSTADMPTLASSVVYGLLNSQLDINDFSSLMVIYSANAVVSLGTPIAPDISASMALFIHLTAIQKINLAAAVLTPTGPLGVLASLSSAFKAVCFFVGPQVSTGNVGADATGTAYWISSADPV